MFTDLMQHVEEIAALILFGIGFTNLLLNRNMMKKIIGFSMMDSAIYLFLASYGYIEGREAPVITDPSATLSVENYVNPLPAGLVLTGIVVSVSVTAIMLALTVRLYRRYNTLDIDRIALLAKEADEA
ncbi:MAG: cation:proton antiporter subunit C [Christensenellales bacterium]|nr:cation:proton antiporter subunit C [Christensenellales bacterium]